MKKTIVIILALLSIASAKILVKGVDIANLDEHYIKMKVSTVAFPIRYYAYVDYGQDVKFRDKVVINEFGGKRVFASEIEVLNTFYKNGWEIKSAVSKTHGGSDGSSVDADTYYILERRDSK